MKTLLTCLLVTTAAFAAEVSLEKVPEGGVQPQIVTTSDGTRHLVYLKREARGCDLRHRCRNDSRSADGSEPGVPVWSFPAAYTDGERFVAMY